MYVVTRLVLCMYVIVCMYVVMYIHIIPILSTTVLSDIHYYNTYTILFVYILRTCISIVVCAKCKCGCIIILITKWCMYFTHVFTHTLPCLCSTAPPSPSYAATCSLPSWLLIFIILSLVFFFVITLFLSLFGVTRFETGIYMCT